MNKTQEQIIIESLLGDGYIYENRLELFSCTEAHSIKQKKEYYLKTIKK